MVTTIMQGDAYSIGMTIKLNGESLTQDDLSEVEVCVEGLEPKTMSSGDVTYQQSKWWFPITQQETFSLKGKCDVVVRIKLADGGNVIGKIVKNFNILEGLSKEIL